MFIGAQLVLWGLLLEAYKTQTSVFVTSIQTTMLPLTK